MTKKKKQEWTTPDEGLSLLEKAEQEHSGYENIPIIDFEIDLEPKKFRTKSTSIRLTEYILDGFEKLSEEFIRGFQSKVSWYNISYNQELNEEFIREFQDKVDWKNISKYQKASKQSLSKINNEYSSILKFHS